MQLFNSTKDYGAIPQALHWLTVILVALAWALGTFDDVLPKGGPVIPACLFTFPQG